MKNKIYNIWYKQKLIKMHAILDWHYSHGKGRHVKGVNILSCLVHYDNISLPIGYEIVHKDIVFCDIKSKEESRPYKERAFS